VTQLAVNPNQNFTTQMFVQVTTKKIRTCNIIS